MFRKIFFTALILMSFSCKKKDEKLNLDKLDELGLKLERVDPKKKELKNVEPKTQRKKKSN